MCTDYIKFNFLNNSFRPWLFKLCIFKIYNYKNKVLISFFPEIYTDSIDTIFF